MWNVKSLEEAKHIIDTLSLTLKEITLPIDEAVNYVLSKDVFSQEDVPAFNKSTVDGYACKYLDIVNASETSPAILKVVGKMEMGKSTDYLLKQNEAYYVPTGAFIPNGCDTVVMIEQTELLNQEVLIYKKTSPFQHIVKTGEDIKKDKILISKNNIINPRVIGILKSQNIKEVTVYEKLRFTIISTGDEIKNQEQISLGEVRDINTHTISTFIKNLGHIIIDTHVINDDYELYKETIKNATNSHIIISSGGSSVGEKDYTIHILNDLSYKNLLHGIHVKPGKPTILSTKGNQIFLGLPGHPLSAYNIMLLLLKRIINSVYNLDNYEEAYTLNTLSENIHNNSGRTLIKLVKLINNHVVPLHTKSALMTSLSEAYGYIIIDSLTEGLYKGETVKVYPLGD